MIRVYMTCSKLIAEDIQKKQFDWRNSYLEVHLSPELAIKSSCLVDEFLITLDVPEYLISPSYSSILLGYCNDFWKIVNCEITKIETRSSEKNTTRFKNPSNGKNPYVNENNLVKYEKLVEVAYNKYKEHKDEIEFGFLSSEMIELLNNALGVKLLSNEELNELWFAVDLFFHNLIFITDEKGVIHYKTDEFSKNNLRWWMDCDSAWKEIINCEVRCRRDKCKSDK